MVEKSLVCKATHYKGSKLCTDNSTHDRPIMLCRPM